MKNKFEIKDDYSILYIDRPDGSILEVIVDTEDIPKISEFHNLWGATNHKDRWIIRGTYSENKIKKNIALSRYILNIMDNTPVRFINKNPLDHRKSNLTVGYEEVQIIKGNNYYIKDNIAYIKLYKRDKTEIITTIDVDDLERVLEKGTWFAEWNNHYQDYLVQNVTYTYEDGKKHRKKISLNCFILNSKKDVAIKYIDNNRLNNCKVNLMLYNEKMLNDYEIRDDGVVEIILRDKYGNEKARTLVDEEDLERIINNGYTWFYFISTGEPYVVGKDKSSKKRAFLHRFIMNPPNSEIFIDHINHNTLDNRKQNLKFATNSENQQNRLGPRKNSKSGIRGVSWSSKDNCWVVVVKGEYFGNFKDIKEAEALAKIKIDELMPYLKDLQNDK